MNLGLQDKVAIVGGGLFPRTALILRELLPHAFDAKQLGVA